MSIWIWLAFWFIAALATFVLDMRQDGYAHTDLDGTGLVVALIGWPVLLLIMLGNVLSRRIKAR